MAVDESLAARIRDALARTKNVEERTMFGCVCFFLDGNVLAGSGRTPSSPDSAPTRGKGRRDRLGVPGDVRRAALLTSQAVGRKGTA